MTTPRPAPVTTTPLVARPRRVERLVTGRPTSDGAGVKLTRVLTQDLQRRLDPFLMLDAFGSDDADDYIAGFPDHPHRGFETVTYMIAGRMRHRDSAGTKACSRTAACSG
jgi:redox-sensitive bicupin YhaK (pirin superfamily)